MKYVKNDSGFAMTRHTMVDFHSGNDLCIMQCILLKTRITNNGLCCKLIVRDIGENSPAYKTC